jgi:hypothetical protein
MAVRLLDRGVGSAALDSNRPPWTRGNSGGFWTPEPSHHPPRRSATPVAAHPGGGDFQGTMIRKRARLGSSVRCVTGWDDLHGRTFHLRKESIQH